MSNSPYNNRYHWQQGPPPYYPGFINHHIMDPNYRRPFAGPHPDWNNTYHYRRSHGRGRHHRNFHDYCGYDHEEYICFICKDQLQNCEDHGIHLCDGGKEKKEEFVYTVEKENIDAKLEKLVSEIKDCLQNKYESVTESLENYVTKRVDTLNTINKELIDEREHLEKLKKELEVRGTELEKKEKQIVEQEKKFDNHQEKCKKELIKEKEEILRQWQQLRDEITRMEEIHKVQKGRIKLDVGGTIFTTSELTLVRDSESMLAAMFSGRHNIKTEEDGTIFIDRDGTHFRYILNYLREGGIATDALPRSRQVLRELRNEAIYFQLHSLAQQIEKLLK